MPSPAPERDADSAPAGVPQAPPGRAPERARSPAVDPAAPGLSAQAFRRRVLRPAEGVFLFHPRALERMARLDEDDRHLPGGAEVQYHLLSRADFLERLEPENPEALSVIEGLVLPEQVLLLPMPGESVLRCWPERLVLRDYWARRFEGEVARAWQSILDDDAGELALGGVPADGSGAARQAGRAPELALAQIVGPAAAAEAREVLLREGVPGAAEGEAGLARAFMARVVRLRYFAPGTRGCHFPAVGDWRAFDAWLDRTGLHLPAPLAGARLPLLLERSRPGADCGSPALVLPLPEDLAFGRSDPDLPAVLAAATAGPMGTQGPDRDPAGRGADRGAAAELLERRVLEALRRGAAIRSRRLLRPRIAGRTLRAARPLLRAPLALRDFLARVPDLDRRLGAGRSGPAGKAPAGVGLAARLALLASTFAAAQRAELDGRYARALARLAEVLALYRRIARPAPGAGASGLPREAAWPPGARASALSACPAVGVPVPELPDGGPQGAQGDAVEECLTRHIRVAAESFASQLAATWKLPQAQTETLDALVLALTHALAGPFDRAGGADTARSARTARAVLRHLETVLLEGHATYYRLDLRAWIAGGRARRVLPFQGSLKALRALASARRLTAELPWPVRDLDRFVAPLAAISTHIGERLTGALTPRIRDVLERSGFTAASADERSEERIAVRRMGDALTDLIRRRWHLKYADVRDLLARDSLSLPDTDAREWWQGDRLARFDRIAAEALPGVYRPGEIYVKGLQRLGAPLFGTSGGRLLLKAAVLPGLAAWGALTVIGLLWDFLLPDLGHIELATPETVMTLASVLSVGANTPFGRALARGLWQVLKVLVRVLLLRGLGAALARLRRWGPVAWFVELAPVRALYERLLAPLGLGLAILLPPAAITASAIPGDTPSAVWVAVASLAFALGTLLRDTPAGRRRMDDLATGWRTLRERLSHERLADLIAPVMTFFKEATRALADGLHRIRTRLVPRLGEPFHHTLVKGVLAPLWGALEAVVQFYAVVLVEPQTNPIKHFPVVTLGHKLLLPFLPAITAALATMLAPFLPMALVVPVVALTIALLPGFFGFLFWELKENWRLYGANRREAVPPAHIGSHGETLVGLLRRGFHGGTLPKGFDRLRRVLSTQVRNVAPNPAALRRALARLEEVRESLWRFAEQELAVTLRERCGVAGPDGGTGRALARASADPGASGGPSVRGSGRAPGAAEGGGADAADSRPRLAAVEVLPPRIATGEVELRVRLLPRAAREPVTLEVRLALAGSAVVCEVRSQGPANALGPACRREIEAALGWLARRCGAACPGPGMPCLPLPPSLAPLPSMPAAAAG